MWRCRHCIRLGELFREVMDFNLLNISIYIFFRSTIVLFCAVKTGLPSFINIVFC